MKQKAFCIIGAIAAVVFAFAVYFSAEKSIITNELLLANVEALARDEGNSDLYIRSSNGCYYEFSGPKNSEITVSVEG